MSNIPPSAAVTAMDEYLFDLQGYLLLKGAVDVDHVQRMNATIDRYLAMDPPLEYGQWVGAVLAHTYTPAGHDGLNLQQIYEAGEPFEQLIDHPSWIDKVEHFVGG